MMWISTQDDNCQVDDLLQLLVSVLLNMMIQIEDGNAGLY